MNYRTLVLASNYEPIRIVSWQLSVCLYVKGKIDILETYNKVLRSQNMHMLCPSVVRIRGYVRKRNLGAPSFSRRNIFLRDDYTCQYCNTKLSYEKLTFDHIIPKSKGGTTIWENVVSSCRRCNHKKGNKNIRDINMKLLKIPVAPNWLSVMSKVNSPPPEWNAYLSYYGGIIRA